MLYCGYMISLTIKKHKNLPIFFAFYAVAYFTMAFCNAYLQPFLAELGYSPVQRGLLLSATAVVSIIAPIVFGYLSDKHRTMKRYFNISAVLLIVSSFVLYQQTKQVFWLDVLLVAFCGGMFRTILNLQDSWVLEIDAYTTSRYGPIRAFGAVGWIIANPLCALVIARYGYAMLSWVFAFLGLITMAFTVFVLDVQKPIRRQPLVLSDVKALLINREFSILILIFILVNIIATADMYTVVDKILFLQGKQAIIGLRNSVQAITELFLFFGGAYALKRFGGFKLLFFGTAMYIVRFFLYTIAPTPNWIVAVSLLQGLTFPLITVSSKVLIDRISPGHLKSSGQNIANGIGFGLPLLITPVLSGFLVDRFGVDPALLMIGSLGFIALALTAYAYRLNPAASRDS